MAAWATNGGHLKADGKSLEYRCWGPPPEQAPTIVLLHEGLGCVAMWRNLPERLVAATGFGVMAYSRAGYGASDPCEIPRPLDYQTHEGTVVLADVLREAGIKRCILMGHSDGATIAAIYAGSVSDQNVRGLVLMAPHFFTETMGVAAIAAAGARYHDGLRDRLARHHVNVDVAFGGWHDTWTNPEYAASWNVADVIDHWRIPVLAIQGHGDEYGTHVQLDEIESRIYSPFEMVLLGDCGHAPHIDQPDKTLAEVTEFCARLERLEQAQGVTV